MIWGVDPGAKGAFVLLDVKGEIVDSFKMPLTEELNLYDRNEVDSNAIMKRLIESGRDHGNCYNFLIEKPSAYGMLPSSAFHYGYDFGQMLLGIRSACHERPKFIGSAKWTKNMYEEINKDLKPKAKAKIAFDEFWGDPKPRWKDLKAAEREGLIDAALIGKYYLKELHG